MIISLTGFMGCGKSSVGSALRTLLSCPWADLDRKVEAAAGIPIPQIFTTLGEKAFRKMEKETLQAIIDSSTSEDDLSVLSLGGGTILDPQCAALVREKTFCIYLKGSPETLASHLAGAKAERPLLAGTTAEGLPAKIAQMLETREAAYIAAASRTVEIDGKAPEEIASEIRSLLWEIPE